MRITIALLAALGVATAVQAQTQTLGLLVHTDGSYDNGYVLFAPLSSTETYLIDKCGKFIHSWHSTSTPGLAAYLLPDGSVLRGTSVTPGAGQAGTSRTEKISWDGQVLWSFLPETVQGQHHDIEPLPNGNVLIISHQIVTRADLIAMGRKPSLISGQFLSEKVLELEPVGTSDANIVWEWHPEDHLIQDFDATKPGFGVVADHPELIDINFPPVPVGEWLHMNSVKYDPDLDQIVVSSHNSSEIWVIDHSTSIAQAASHKGGRYGKGGDLLYRWGNPAAYRHGTSADEKLFTQHDAMWIPKGLPHAGEMSMFNNGVGRAGQFSEVDRLVLPIDSRGFYSSTTLPYLPASASWTWVDTTPGKVMFSQTMGGAQTLPNGNMLISQSDQGIIIEIDSNGKQVWRYVQPVSNSGILTQGDPANGIQYFKARFYLASYPAFAGRTLTPGPTIELGPTPYTCSPNPVSVIENAPANTMPEVDVYPNPGSDHITLSQSDHAQTAALYNMLGVKVAEAINTNVLNTTALADGMYSLVVGGNGHASVKMVAIQHHR